MDKYNIDSHKLIYHVDRVHEWQQGNNIYPVYMEVSPSGACNHRCVYCGLDFMEYQARYLETKDFKTVITELGRLGLRSIMYAGEGEPLLHRDICEIVRHTKMSGIDVAFTTNAVLMKEEVSQAILPYTEWVKVSINAGTPKTYSSIHRTQENDFEKVISNMSNAVKIRNDKKYACVLGMQLLLLPENMGEVTRLATIAKEIGMDYLVVKPYSQHPQSETNIYSDITYEGHEELERELQSLNTQTFSIVYRANAMNKWNQGRRDYGHCYALPFWAYIDAAGNVWGCSVYLTDDRFHYGNIYESSFEAIWNSEKRLSSLRWVQEEMDATNCRVNCRMDEVNRYLWKLKNPVEHVNFI